MSDVEIIELLVPDTCFNQRVDRVLAELCPDYSRSQLQKWLKAGDINIDGRVMVAKEKIKGGETIHIQAKPIVRSDFEPEDIPLDIRYEDDHLMIINKPSGLVVHPAAGNWSGTLMNALLAHNDHQNELPRAGIVHRLDKDTSGLLVIAKTEKFRSFFVDKLQTREVYKQYEALVVGQVIGSFSIDLAIERDPRNRIKMRTTDFGRDALSHVSLVKFYNGYSHVAVEIETGRTHQIRVHLSHHKLPIIGDRLYNPRNLIARDTSKEVMPLIQQFPRQALHASKIGFASIDSGDQIEFQCSPPEDIRSLISSLATL